LIAGTTLSAEGTTSSVLVRGTTNNYGTVKVASQASIELAAAVNNRGSGSLLATGAGSTLTLDAGVENLGTADISVGAGLGISGTYRGDAGGTLDTHDGGSTTLNNDALLIAGSTLSAEGTASSVLVRGATNNYGTVTAASQASIEMVAAVTNRGSGSLEATGTGSALTLAAGLYNLGTVDVSGGAHLDVSGTDTNLGTMEVQSGSLITLHDASINYGQLTLQDADLLANGPMSNSGTLGVFGATSDLDIESSLGNSAGGSIVVHAGTAKVTGAVSNIGLLEATDGAAITLQGSATGSGQFTADNGSIVAQGATSGHGTAGIANAGQIEFGSSADAHVAFGSGGGGLLVDSTSGFTGDIAGFASGDSMQFNDILAAGATLGYTANGSNTGGTLQITDALQHVFDLNIVGAGYATANFSPMQDASHHLVVQFA
jgi:hypothetical protein